MGKNRNKKHHKSWVLTGNTNRHHNLAQCQGGNWNHSNIFNWDIRIHEAYHFIFGVMTLQEAAQWLIYVDQQKNLGKSLDLQNNVKGSP